MPDQYAERIKQLEAKGRHFAGREDKAGMERVERKLQQAREAQARAAEKAGATREPKRAAKQGGGRGSRGKR